MPASSLSSRPSNGTIPDMTGNITKTIVTTVTDSDNNSTGHDNHFEIVDNEKQQQPQFKQVIIKHEEEEDEENATMIRCPTTSSTSSPQSDDYNDNSSDTLSHNTDTLSADSCDSFCTTQQYPSSESKEELNESHCYSSPLQTHSNMTTTAITLDRIFEDNLSVELLSLFEELLPTRESYDRRMGLVRKIERLLNTEWVNKDIRVHLFGSSVNDLGTSQSDVDLCITTPWNGLRNVRILAKMFKRCSMQHVVCVPRAKVPIVRLSDPESGLACDINVNNTLALQNTKMIKTYVALDPRVRPFIMIIKHWTKQRRLNDAANGGTLSTYTWTCMAINFLQMREPPILPVLHQLSKSEKNNNNDNDDGNENNDDNEVDLSFCMDVDGLQGFGNSNRESLGGLLFAFFRRYAHEFDYEEQVVSIRHGQYLTKEEKGWHVGRNKFSLCVEEPFNVSRNLGNSADQASVQGLLVEFRRACHLLAAGASLDLVCDPYVPIITMSSLRSSTSSTILSSLPNEGLAVKQQHKLLDPSNSSKRGHALSPPPHMIHNNARRSTHPMLQPLPSPTPLPSVVLPVHPHTTTTTATTTAIDPPLHHPHERHRSSENIFIHSSSVTSSPSSNHHSPYLQPIPIDSPSTFRPRFNSVSSSTYSPPVMPTTGSNGYQGGVRNIRHSSHPPMCCTAPAPVPGMPAPIAITIALPPPTSSSYVTTLQQHNNKKSTAMNNNNNGSDHHNRTVDSILARYSSKPPLPPQSQRPRSRNDSTDYHHHRRNSTASNKTNNNNRKRASRQSSIDWPTISPTSSATLELLRQKQGQHQNNNRRRRWSTVKHDAPKKTMADVLKEQHRQEERVPKPSSSSPSLSNVHHNQKPPQQQQHKQYRSRHRPSKTSSSNSGSGSGSSGSGGRNRRKHNNNNNNNTNNNSSNGNKSRH